MADTTRLQSLNHLFPNLPQAVLKPYIDAAARYVYQANIRVRPEHRHVRFMDGLSPDQQRKFEHEFSQNYWKADRQGDGTYRLYYAPKTVTRFDEAGNHDYGQPRLKLLVTYPDEHEGILKKVYDDPKLGLGTGIQQFYYQVCMNYLGITREECEQFLEKQSAYQMTRGQHHRGLHRSTQASGPNERWEVDCTDVIKYGVNPKKDTQDSEYNIKEHNHTYAKHSRGRRVAGRSYFSILVAVDVFSGYVFAEPLHKKDSYHVTEAFKTMIADAKTYPRIVQCDNGPEFSDKFSTFVTQLNVHGFPNCEKHRCNILHTLSHSPTSNAMVERANQEIKKRIREGFVRNNELEWVQHLQDYIFNINHQHHSRNGFTPALLWRPGYVISRERPLRPREELETHLDQTPVERIRESVAGRNTRVIKRQVNEVPTHVFRDGDVVRLALSAYIPEMRARIKGDMENKYSAIRWSTQLYQVTGSRPPLFVKQHQINAPLRDAPEVYYRRRGNKLVKYQLPLTDAAKQRQEAEITQLGIRLYDVTRPLYHLRELDTGDALAKWYPGEDLLYCGDINHLPVPAAIKTDTRAMQLNRMKGFSYSGPHMDE